MQPFVAIDFETANEKRGSACAVGLVKFDSDGREESSFSTLIRPHDDLAYFNPRNIGVHGIRATDVADAPAWSDIYPEISGFVEGLPLVAHNMAFDGYVLTDLDALYGYEPLTNQRMCTLRIARKLLDGVLSRKSLDLVYSHYFNGETFSHHEAAADALACGRVFARMQEQHGFDYLASLISPRKRPSRPWSSVLNPEDLKTLKATYGGSEALIGARVAFTGSLVKTNRATIQGLVTELGGVAEKSLTRKTTVLVVGIGNPELWKPGAKGSAKLEKARAMQDGGADIKILTEDEFLTSLE